MALWSDINLTVQIFYSFTWSKLYLDVVQLHQTSVNNDSSSTFLE